MRKNVGKTEAAVVPAYHHGQLKDALVAAALAVVERDGHDAVSMRELATQVGVSSAAPYRHFPDRLSLLAAVACEGYRDLRRRHAEAAAGPGAPLARLKEAMRAFLRFSEERSGLFQLMYSGLFQHPQTDSGLLALEAQTFDEVAASVAAALPSLDKPQLLLRMTAFWATLYGHAVVRQRHMLRPYMIAGLVDADIDEAVIDAAIGPLPGPARRTGR